MTIYSTTLYIDDAKDSDYVAGLIAATNGVSVYQCVGTRLGIVCSPMFLYSVQSAVLYTERTFVCKILEPLTIEWDCRIDMSYDTFYERFSERQKYKLRRTMRIYASNHNAVAIFTDNLKLFRCLTKSRFNSWTDRGS